MTDYSLPSELWMKAFLCVDSMKDLQQCALICTKWKQMAESHIFSRNIMVKGSLQTRTLQMYLIRHIEKRCALKHITLGRQDHFTLDMKYLMPVAIIPSLETLEGTILDDQFFIILLETIENGQTELMLKIIPSALTYSNTYDAILYQLKESLEEVQLNFKKYTANTWTTLYNLEQITTFTIIKYSIKHSHHLANR
ncbi:uncharacterized protein ATC70_007724 [Mucor velutinosus]|uniref:F-box domain-containing protein n=1 Tax=Mucor velutinosus TaxID=708070 RepID=A0AAN7D2K4_9FUNG|nr:hypothetical protein ATC70_007724 [Mucor velutinosus]